MIKKIDPPRPADTEHYYYAGGRNIGSLASIIEYDYEILQIGREQHNVNQSASLEAQRYVELTFEIFELLERAEESGVDLSRPPTEEEMARVIYHRVVANLVDTAHDYAETVSRRYEGGKSDEKPDEYYEPDNYYVEWKLRLNALEPWVGLTHLDPPENAT